MLCCKILKAFQKTFPTKMKPLKCPAKENKTWQEKRKKKEGEKAKNRGQDCCANFKPKNHLKILISAHAQSLQGNILHLDQKALC